MWCEYYHEKVSSLLIIMAEKTIEFLYLLRKINKQVEVEKNYMQT
jgi:hypothetical protein